MKILLVGYDGHQLLDELHQLQLVSAEATALRDEVLMACGRDHSAHSYPVYVRDGDVAAALH